MPPRIAALLSLFVALLAGAGLAALVNYTQPASVWMALAAPLLAVAVTGLSIPLWLLVQRRLTPKLPRGPLVRTALREGLWSGLYVTLLAALRVFGYLDWVMVMVLAALFIMLELFLQQRRQHQQAAQKVPAVTKPSSASPTASYGRSMATPKGKRKRGSENPK